jgi:hypothetical protein
MEAEVPAAAATLGSSRASASSAAAQGSPSSPTGENNSSLAAAAATAAAPPAAAASRWADLEEEEGGSAARAGSSSRSSKGSALGKRPRALLPGLSDGDILSSVDKALGRPGRPAAAGPGAAAAAAAAVAGGGAAARATPGASSSRAAARPILIRGARLSSVRAICLWRALLLLLLVLGPLLWQGDAGISRGPWRLQDTAAAPAPPPLPPLGCFRAWSTLRPWGRAPSARPQASGVALSGRVLARAAGARSAERRALRVAWPDQHQAPAEGFHIPSDKQVSALLLWLRLRLLRLRLQPACCTASQAPLHPVQHQAPCPRPRGSSPRAGAVPVACSAAPHTAAPPPRLLPAQLEQVFLVSGLGPPPELCAESDDDLPHEVGGEGGPVAHGPHLPDARTFADQVGGRAALVLLPQPRRPRGLLGGHACRAPCRWHGHQLAAPPCARLGTRLMAAVKTAHRPPPLPPLTLCPR